MLSLRSRRFTSPVHRRRAVGAAVLSVLALIGGCALLGRAIGGPNGVYALSHMADSVTGAATGASDLASSSVTTVATLENPAPFNSVTTVAAQQTAMKQAVHPVSGKPVRAEIVTCPACRLNSLPLVKKFVMDEAKLYEPALKVNFIVGEDPKLHLYEDGNEVQVIDLAVRELVCVQWKFPLASMHESAITTTFIRAMLLCISHQT